jgi:four helix bundle protein
MVAESEATGYEKLEVYRRAMALVPKVQNLIRSLPSSERYAMASQIRRASRSVPANIAEGYAKRRSAKEFCAYLTTAMGSANEMQVHLKIASELGYLQDGNELFDVVGRQLNKLIASWRRGPPEAVNQQQATSN